MIRNLENDLKLALALADISDKLCIEKFQKRIKKDLKFDGSPVTELDLEIENHFRQILSKERPNDKILGEELGNSEQPFESVDATWVIDPLDQTRHFMRGNPDYGTLIGLIVNGHPSLGVISAPSLGHRWWAIHGGGAWFNGSKIFVSKTTSLNSTHLGLAGHREWHNSYEWATISELTSNVEYLYGTAGGFSPSMLVASGKLDAFVEPWGSIWDHIATAAIITESGGKASTLSGGFTSGGSLIVSNGILHDEILSYFRYNT